MPECSVPFCSFCAAAFYFTMVVEAPAEEIAKAERL
jgi:hypothetical protein